jgi:AbrB family transcriptional regulator, transcriptional pleiotropic regulator of transition state genes
MDEIIYRGPDELGRLVIPKEIRERLGMSARDEVEIYADGERIVLRKHRTQCVLCGNEGFVIYHRGKTVCEWCIEDMRLLW